MKTVVVTGAGGFVGGTVCAYLRQSGFHIIPTVRTKSHTMPDALVWDITEPYTKAPLHPDYVVHCAGVVSDSATYREARQANVGGTTNVLDAFPNATRFIYISSASVYDPHINEYIITETSKAGTNLLNAYSKTKYEAEQAVLGHRSTSQKIILRPHVIYGTGEKKILTRLLRAHRFGRFLILGDGRNRISITHVENLCTAIRDAMICPTTLSNEIFNVADLHPVHLNDLISHIKNKFHISSTNLHIPKPLAYRIGTILEHLARFTGTNHPPLLSRYVVHQMTGDHCLSLEKTTNMLHYKPMKSFMDF